MEFKKRERRGREVRKRTKNNDNEDANIENHDNQEIDADSRRDATREQSPKRLKTLRECRQSDRECRGAGRGGGGGEGGVGGGRGDSNQRRETPIEAGGPKTHPSEDVREDETDNLAMYSSQVK